MSRDHVAPERQASTDVRLPTSSLRSVRSMSRSIGSRHAPPAWTASRVGPSAPMGALVPKTTPSESRHHSTRETSSSVAGSMGRNDHDASMTACEGRHATVIMTALASTHASVEDALAVVMPKGRGIWPTSSSRSGRIGHMRAVPTTFVPLPVPHIAAGRERSPWLGDADPRGKRRALSSGGRQRARRDTSPAAASRAMAPGAGTAFRVSDQLS